jgi:hypothetical protein
MDKVRKTMTTHTLAHEALNLLFEKYGKPQIAPDRFKE